MISDLATELGVEIDPEVFVTEHGIGTFMPFIARYFPHATVVAIAYPGEPPREYAHGRKTLGGHEEGVVRKKGKWDG